MGSSSENDKTGTAKKAVSNPSLLGNMMEDLGNIFSGDVPGVEVDGKISYAHSAHDVRNAKAAANEYNGHNAKAIAAGSSKRRAAQDYVRGGQYGPGGGSYSPSALHKAGIQVDAARTATLSQKDQHNKSSGLLSTKAPDPAIGARLAEDEPSAIRANAVTEQAPQTVPSAAAPTLAPTAQPSQKATSALSVSSSRPNKLAGTPPGMTGSATPAQQAKNVRAFQAHQAKQAAQQAKAQQAAEKARQSPQAAPNARTYTQAQLSGAAQAKRTNTITRQRVNDYLSEMSKPKNQPANRPAGMTAAEARKAAWSTVKSAPTSTSRTQDQKAADVGEQPLSGTVGQQGTNNPADVAKAQSALVAQGTLDPKHATGYPGTAMVDAIKTLQQRRGLPLDGTVIPGGQTESELFGAGPLDTPPGWGLKSQTVFGPSIQVASNEDLNVFQKGFLSSLKVAEEILNGTAEKRREAQKKAKKAAAKQNAADNKAYERYMQQYDREYKHNGNNLLNDSNNTMPEEDRKEVGTIAGKELLGGIAKVISIPVGNKFSPAGAALDLLGDGILDSAKKDKKRSGLK